MELVIFATISAFISTIASLLWSIYKETRFVGDTNILFYGIAAIVFGLAYLAIPLPQNFEFLRLLGTILPVGYGLILGYLFFSQKSSLTDKGSESLIISGKTNGSFQLAFLLPTLITIPIISAFSKTIILFDNLLFWLIGIFVISWLISGLLRWHRN
jgi:hypothetical protein